MILVEFLSHPIFHHLVHLNLHSSEITSLDPLVKSQHTFTALHTLDLSTNWNLFIPFDQIPHKFPNLKDLNLLQIQTVESPTTRQQQQLSPPPTTFQLKKLSIPIEALQYQQLNFQQYLSQLTHLRLSRNSPVSNFIAQLFHPQECVMRFNLT